MIARYKDPSFDPDATVGDFVYRLRRMGYPGNVRVEFPIYTVEDVKWTAKLMEDASRALIHCVSDPSLNPLQRVLQARAVMVYADHQLKTRTSHRRVKRNATSGRPVDPGD